MTGSLAEIHMRELDFDSDTELQLVAKAYVDVPHSWDSAYTYPQSTIDKNSAWLKENKSKLLCLTCWKETDLIGLHILFFDSEKESRECFIKTLWVSPVHRKMGLAKKMKIAGESWAKKRSAKILITHVFLENQKMLKMNEANGFVPKKVELHKNIDSLNAEE